MSDNWDFFFTTVEEAPASISVDLGLSQTAPDPERPSLGWIWIYMEHPREDGMPSQPESERLSSIEVHLCARLEEQIDAVYVGRATTRGRRELYFYVAEDAPFLEVAKEALADGPVVRAEQGLRDDPEWTFYFESLFPTPEELELIQNRRTVFALQERGDGGGIHSARHGDSDEGARLDLTHADNPARACAAAPPTRPRRPPMRPPAPHRCPAQARSVCWRALRRA